MAKNPPERLPKEITMKINSEDAAVVFIDPQNDVPERNRTRVAPRPRKPEGK